MNNHEKFLQALNEKKLVKLTVNTKEKGVIERVCVPYDFGPSRRPNLKMNPEKYHFWHKETGHPSGFIPSQIISLEITEKPFDPIQYVTWNPPYNWFISRDWGKFS